MRIYACNWQIYWSIFKLKTIFLLEICNCSQIITMHTVHSVLKFTVNNYINKTNKNLGDIKNKMFFFIAKQIRASSTKINRRNLPTLIGTIWFWSGMGGGVRCDPFFYIKSKNSWVLIITWTVKSFMYWLTVWPII